MLLERWIEEEEVMTTFYDSIGVWSALNGAEQ